MTRIGQAIVAACLLLAGSGTVLADAIRVAVASNFKHAIKPITERFETLTGHRVTLIFGATGKHYAQIMNGAPFDVFLAADTKRPRLLEERGKALAGSRFTYALGRLVLWSPDPALVDARGKVLDEPDFRYLAIANPKLAPYGKAAREVLEARGLWESMRGRVVRGENVAQAFQFVSSGNADLGFVAYSLLRVPGRPATGSVWEVPATLYSPIDQQAVLLRSNDTAESFLSFVRSSESLAIIRDFGYATP